MNTYTLYFDGCSKGNPGPSGAGAVIYDVLMKEIWSVAHFVGSNNTNNEAEYTGLLVGLRRAVEMGMTDLLVCGDSQLIIRQMKGEYKVKSASLRPTTKTTILLFSQKFNSRMHYWQF
jgi:ribonuclease HI